MGQLVLLKRDTGFHNGTEYAGFHNGYNVTPDFTMGQLVLLKRDTGFHNGTEYAI